MSDKFIGQKYSKCNSSLLCQFHNTYGLVFFVFSGHITYTPLMPFIFINSMKSFSWWKLISTGFLLVIAIMSGVSISVNSSSGETFTLTGLLINGSWAIVNVCGSTLTAYGNSTLSAHGITTWIYANGVFTLNNITNGTNCDTITATKANHTCQIVVNWPTSVTENTSNIVWYCYKNTSPNNQWLLFYYPFNWNSNDESWNWFDLYLPKNQYSSGKYDQAWVFPWTRWAHWYFPYHPSLQPTSWITLAARVNTTTLTTQQNIVSRYNWIYRFRIEPFWTWVRMFMLNTTQRIAYSSWFSITPWEWVHLAVTMSSVWTYFYVNGTLLSSNNNIKYSWSYKWYEWLLIWAHDSSSEYFIWQLDEVRGYSYAMNPSQIYTIYTLPHNMVPWLAYTGTLPWFETLLRASYSWSSNEEILQDIVFANDKQLKKYAIQYNLRYMNDVKQYKHTSFNKNIKKLVISINLLRNKKFKQQ